MTRDFDKQRRERDDMRPYTRRQPPHRPGEERFERQDRPRLNRETVDRAWENGAQINHADYRGRNGNSQPRSGQQGRQSRQSRQYDQRQRFSGQNGRNSSGPGYRRDYGSNSYEREREESGYRNDRYPSSRGNAGQRPRSYNNDRLDERRSNGYQERNRSSDFRGNDRNYGRPYPNREQGQGYSSRPPRYPERDNRSSSYNGRGQRPSSGNAPYETRPPRRNNYRQHEQGQYEGDYERFSSFGERPERRQGQRGTQRFERRQPEERHVTRLPDGRVLKGSRPAQRKNAQFWSEISEDSDALVPRAHENEQAGHGTKKPAGSAGGQRKREKKTGSKPESQNNAPRPSQRGFKWPRPEPEE